MSTQGVDYFSAAELGSRVDKADYDNALSELRVDLLNLQYDLQHADFSVILLFAGDDRPGVIEAARTLHDWMDSRHIETNVMYEEGTEAERSRPLLWRYWSRLPPKGKIGLFLGAWPSLLVRNAFTEGWSPTQLDTMLEHIQRFEGELVKERLLLLKFWFHLSKDQHKQRLTAAEANPELHWQFEQRDWEILENYDQGMQLVEQVVRRTDTGAAPWSIIESTDVRYRNLTMGRQIAAALRSRLGAADLPVVEVPPVTFDTQQVNLLNQVDLNASVDSGEYSTQLSQLQGRLNELARAASSADIASLIAFEGVDAAGKGGTIRRIASAIPISNIKVVPIAAPTEEERARHYLWRFWRHLPAKGNMVIFDRSWYGRVLVERVEGFATAEQWGRAYEEINDFESMLDQSGIPVIKFWLQIDQAEQDQRFEARAQTPYKKYKLTDEDLRNREKWDQYQQAANDMLAKTSTSAAPWYVLASVDKRHARLKALQIVCERLESRLLSTQGEDWRKSLFQAPGKPAGSSSKRTKGSKTGKNGKNGKKEKKS